jgi:two-component system chemotaxis response regulator CheY
MKDSCPEECRVGIGIAIVEDEKGLVEVYKRIFKKNNIEICFIAFDGREAIKKYIECTPRPHVVLMDFRLPILNGLDATKEILKFDPDAKIIFLSADIDVKEDAFKAGAIAFLKKPAGLKEMVDSVESALKTRKIEWAR